MEWPGSQQLLGLRECCHLEGPLIISKASSATPMPQRHTPLEGQLMISKACHGGIRWTLEASDDGNGAKCADMWL